MITRMRSLAAVVLASLVLTGCATGAAEQAAEPPAARHTMPDGTEMQGSHHPKPHGDNHDPGRGGNHATGHGGNHGSGHGGNHGADHGVDHDSHGSDPVGPSAAARMVCTGQVVDDVTRIMELSGKLDPSSSWEAPMFTCTFEVDEGPLVLTVHDAPNARSGREYFDTLRDDLGDTRPLKGVYALGLPAYETTDGTVVFIKDGKTLKVDATALPGQLGLDDNFSQTEAAYAVATSVLACWTKHT